MSKYSQGLPNMEGSAARRAAAADPWCTFTSAEIWTRQAHLICASDLVSLLRCGQPLPLATHHVPLRLPQELVHLASLATAHALLLDTDMKTDIRQGHAAVASHLISCLERAVTYHDRTVYMLLQMPVMLSRAG